MAISWLAEAKAMAIVTTPTSQTDSRWAATPARPSVSPSRAHCVRKAQPILRPNLGSGPL